MTHTPEHDPPLSPQQEAAVRRALARAGGPEPMPGEVAGRLDRVIAGLAAERAQGVAAVADPAPHEAGVVVPMDAAARRRRTRVRVLLAAAAFVVASGVAAGIVRGTDGGDAAFDASTAEGPARGSASEGGDVGAVTGGAADAPEGADGGAAAPQSDELSDTASVQGKRVLTDEPLHKVRADRLRTDLVALQATLPSPARADYRRTTLRAPRDFVCAGAAFGRGILVGVEYDARPALVAFREPMGSSQVAEVIACGSGDVLQSMTLPTR
jgi:hypothetical protein